MQARQSLEEKLQWQTAKISQDWSFGVILQSEIHLMQIEQFQFQAVDVLTITNHQFQTYHGK